MTARVPPELAQLRPLIEPLLARLSDLLPGCRLILVARQTRRDRWEVIMKGDGLPLDLSQPEQGGGP